jgi:hypothetical protein
MQREVRFLTEDDVGKGLRSCFLLLKSCFFASIGLLARVMLFFACFAWEKGDQTTTPMKD